MKAQPVTVIEPQIRALVAGRLSHLYRPAGTRLERARPGDLLWLREPFWLPKLYDHLSPSQADQLGAIPNFNADFAIEELQRHPIKRRFARELLRTWHRQHLRIIDVRRERLPESGHGAIQEQGFANATEFARAWDHNLALSRSADRWANNPEVIVIEFDRISTPLPGEPGIQFGGMSPQAEGEARDPSPPKRVLNASTSLQMNEGNGNG